MWVWDEGCSVLDEVWYWLEEAGVFGIPVAANIVSLILNIFWGIFGCDFWT